MRQEHETEVERATWPTFLVMGAMVACYFVWYGVCKLHAFLVGSDHGEVQSTQEQ